MRTPILIALLMASTTRVGAQAVVARPADVASLDAIVAAYYDVITGPAGQPRQWDRDNSLYWPGIRFFAASTTKDGTPKMSVMSHQQFVDATNDQMVKNGFSEREIHRTTSRIGNIAHVMSTYQTRDVGTGPITGRGVNSLDLYWDGKRWWITAASWDDERPGSPIPAELLPK